MAKRRPRSAAFRFPEAGPGLRGKYRQREMLFRYQLAIADEQFAQAARRRDAVTAKTFPAYKADLHRKMLSMLGPLPKGTPLRPRVVGVVKRPGYRIEKVVFESLPRFYVTANLYIPAEGEPPFPGVLSPCGHAGEGKAADLYQHVYVSLVRKGFVVLAYDPLGQGERSQYWDAGESRSLLGLCVPEHINCGNQLYLLGENLAKYRSWDGGRALDYLAGRSEVDAERIGCTGNSGGGTLTTYLVAFDDRLRAGAPGCYVTTLRERFLSRKSADPEQNLLPQVAEGIDHFEYLAMHAPKPLIICAAKKDFFPIKGARQAYRWLRQLYGTLGVREKVAKVEVDLPHGFSQPLREGMYRWFQRWLGPTSGEKTWKESPLTVEKPETLWCTKTGQVATSLDDQRTIHFFITRTLREVVKKHPRPTRNRLAAYRNRVKADLLSLLAIDPPKGKAKATTSKEGEAGSLVWEHVVIEPEAGIRMPGILYRPRGARQALPALLLVHGLGKEAALFEARRAAARGMVVLAVDIRGVGETRSQVLAWNFEYDAPYGTETDLNYMSFMIGRPLLGQRTLDVLAAARCLAGRKDVEGGSAVARGVGLGGLTVLLASALDTVITEAVVEDIPVDYRSMVEADIYRHQSKFLFPGVLQRLDLPDVAALVAPRRLTLINLLDAQGHPLDPEAARRRYRPAMRVFRRLKASRNLRFARRY